MSLVFIFIMAELAGYLGCKRPILNMLKRFNMHNFKVGDVPMVKGDKLSIKQCLHNDIEMASMSHILYASATRSLMYT